MKKILIAVGLFMSDNSYAQNDIPTETSYVQKSEILNLEKFENSLRYNYVLKDQISKKYSIYEEMKKYKIPGISIAAIHNGKIVWIKSYGYKDSQSKEKLYTRDLMQAASISKPFAVLGGLKLASENKFDLDSDINKYLVGWKIPLNKYTKITPVTARMLMSHIGGINVHGFPGIDRSVKPFPTIIDVLNGKKPFVTTDAVEVINTPGKSFSYSGGGTSIVQLAIESIVKEDFTSWMDKNILKKLDMNSSSFHQPLLETNDPFVSSAHNKVGVPYASKYHNYPENAAAGLWTNPTDLANSILHLIGLYYGDSNNLNLDRDLVKQIFIAKKPSQYGLGFEIIKNKKVLSFGHGGSNDGFNSIMYAFVNNSNKNKEKKLMDALIVMTNSDNGMYINEKLIHSFNDVYNIGFKNKKILNPIKIKDNLEKYSLNFKFLDEDDLNIIKFEKNALYLEYNSLSEKLYPVGKDEFMTLQGIKIKYFWSNKKPFIKFYLTDDYELETTVL
ncbi:serine hydrolase [Silvanigrella paludirubra]|uniref:Serine hydrolase n=1 Tax=Silvanigrella paludirubra TaxID=2499159 RepID=A0A6N6VUK9_9BACT|nr:serine hydrolase domain-containing protein [Silvanigrella paludirubra]KAB8040025.1 serine hydrolase [Silvanigrella paludirubra]